MLLTLLTFFGYVMRTFNDFINEMQRILNIKEAQFEIRYFFEEKFRKNFWFLSEHDKSINEYVNKNSKENSVRIGVGTGIISEYLIEHVFNKFKSDDIPELLNINPNNPNNFSSGDFVFDNEVIELKTSRTKYENGKDKNKCFSGATHSDSKTDKYLFIKYDLDVDKPINEVGFLKGIFVLGIKEISKEMWYGKPTKNSSFTTIKFPREMLKELKEGLIYGSFKENYHRNVKYVEFYCGEIC
jgi:hypothetical protein